LQTQHALKDIREAERERERENEANMEGMMMGFAVVIMW
jgi:hypothetical protein